MSGFKNDVVFAKNGDFSASDNLSPSESNGLVTNGQLWIGTTAPNIGGTNINVGSITSPNSSITFGYTTPNITATVNTSVVRGLHTAQYIVSAAGSAAGANYTTIQTAIDAASAAGGGIVVIQEGTYTENLILQPNVNLAAFGGGSLTPRVTIIGKATFTAAGTLSISFIQLQTNGDNFLAVTGSAASTVNLNNCYLNCSNATGITYSSSSASAFISITDCTGDLGTTGIAIYTMSSPGRLSFTYCRIVNSGGSALASTSSAGSVVIEWCNLQHVFSVSGSANITMTYCVIGGAGNTSALTLSGTSVGALEATRVVGNSGSALSIGAGCVVEVKGYIDVISTNANAITGAGQIKFNKIYYYFSDTNNVSTKSAFRSEFGIEVSTLQPVFIAIGGAAQSNVTGDATLYTVLFTTEVKDQNSNYASPTFTAPITGSYQLNTNVQMTGLTASHTNGNITFITSNRNYGSEANYAAMRSSATGLAQTLSTIADMDSADTCTVRLAVDNGTKVVSVTNNPSINNFSAILLC